MGNSCHYDLTPHFFDKSFLRYTPLPSSKKSYATSAKRNKHQQRNSRGPLCKILRITQTRQFVLHRIISPKSSEYVCPMCPITLVMNITTMLKVRKMLNYIHYTIFAIFANMLNYIRKMFHHRCLKGSYLRLCLSTNDKCTSKFSFIILL